MIKNIKVEEILEASNSTELFNLYFNEGSRGLLPSLDINKPIFYALDSAGLLDCFGVYHLDTLVGFVIASTSIMPHYNCLGTTIMSIYIHKDHRKFGVSKQLLMLVEQCAIDRGSKAILLSSPIDSKFGKFSTTLGFKKTNEFYGKALI